jgi:hypothetical protein
MKVTAGFHCTTHLALNPQVIRHTQKYAAQARSQPSLPTENGETPQRRLQIRI